MNNKASQNKQSHAIRLLGYEEVADRIELFYEKNYKGCIITSLLTPEQLCVDVAIIAAYIYKEKPKQFPIATSPEILAVNPLLPLFIADGYGIAREVKGGAANADNWIENCETSAVGRALATCGYGSGACREEILYVNKQQDDTEPSDKQKAKLLALRKPLFPNDALFSQWVENKFKVSSLKEITSSQVEEMIYILENPPTAKNKKTRWLTYETVAERTKRFNECYPDGKIVSRLLTPQEGISERAIFQTYVFKDSVARPANESLLNYKFNNGVPFYEHFAKKDIYYPFYLADGMGHAVEIAGGEGASKYKWVENCETSARGRALRHTKIVKQGSSIPLPLPVCHLHDDKGTKNES